MSLGTPASSASVLKERRRSRFLAWGTTQRSRCRQGVPWLMGFDGSLAEKRGFYQCFNGIHRDPT